MIRSAEIDLQCLSEHTVVGNSLLPSEKQCCLILIMLLRIMIMLMPMVMMLMLMLSRMLPFCLVRVTLALIIKL